MNSFHPDWGSQPGFLSVKKKVLKKAVTKRSSPETLAGLKKKIAAQAEELREGAEQQAATREILRLIARTSGDLQSVMDAIAENAAQLCDADDALVWRVDGNGRQLVSHFGASPTVDRLGEHQPVERGTPTGRAVIDRKTIHVHDLLAARAEFPAAESRGIAIGIRSTVATPLLRDQVPVGVIHIRRMEVRPFTSAQIKLLETFADQAVIAIENARLFNELGNRNRQLTESLEQQTATSEVLRVISSSPIDLQPVFDTILANTTRLCEANIAALFLYDGEFLTTVAHYGTTREFAEFLKGTRRPGRETATRLAALERRTVHVLDLLADPEFSPPSRELYQKENTRTVLSVPLLRENSLIGVITTWRREIRAFSDKQISLLKTFADQAVIAIENVRLFKELQTRNRDLTKALEQQTATGEVLRVIASSPTQLQPVLDTLIANAVKLSGATKGHIRQVDGEFYRVVAHYGETPDRISFLRDNPLSANADTPTSRAFMARKPIHLMDVQLEPEPLASFVRQTGVRTLLAAPLLREGTVIGVIIIWREVVEPFTERQIELVKTFADQAVIAIENVRLFKELEDRNAELREALEHQTATAEVLSIISRSPTDVQPVLDAIVESAARVCGVEDIQLRLRENESMVSRAHFGPVPIGTVEASVDAAHIRWMREHGTLHIPDVRAQDDFPRLGVLGGWRTLLVVPLFQQSKLMGALYARRNDVRPFTSAQIKLLETFADQAVIAIENARLFQELKESLEQQTATSEIFGVIAGSPTDVQPVLDTVAKNAARLCEATDAQIRLVEGDGHRLVASFGTLPAPEFRVTSPDNPFSRAILTRETIHIHDVQESGWAPSSGTRTLLSTPMLREGIPLGLINIRRTEVRPFSERQVKLLETFAAQAVIAIENVRLFKEIQERNAELREALEHQTATSEVLGIISRSPTDVQPVLDAIVESAARVCGIDDVVLRLREVNIFVPRAHFGPMPINRLEVGIDEPQYRWLREHGTLHVPDTREQPELLVGVLGGWRTLLAVPLRQQGELIGSLNARRTEVHPFTPAQIKLLETFADQAVIAIENVRLFKELEERNRQITEALEQQTATSEILRVIASSPTDIQPVLDTVAENAARLCEATDAVISRIDEGLIKQVAQFGAMPIPEPNQINRKTPVGCAIVDKKTIAVDDLATEIESEYPESEARQKVSGSRSMLVTPLMREGVPIGTINIRRTEVRPFSEKHVKLLETFADQAVIAIENVRLFSQLEERNRQVTEALEQQTATSEILRVIASSPTDIQPVLDVVAENAARLCEAADANIYRVDGDGYRLVASYGSLPIPDRDKPRPLIRGLPPGRAMIDREIVHIIDLMSPEAQTELPEGWAFNQRAGLRTVLVAPLLREGISIGAIFIRRTVVRPFTEKQIELLKTFADQAVIAIENVRLFQELEARTQELARSVGELKALGEVGQAVSSTLDLQTVLSTIVGRAVQLSGTNCGIIYEYDEPTREFHLRASYQMEEELVKAYQATPLHPGEGATGRAAETKVPVQVDDLSHEHEFATRGMRPILTRLGYQSLLAVPLLLDQKLMGALTIYRRQTGSFAPEVVNLLQTFATQSVLAIQNARLFREIEAKGRELEAANRHKSEFLANVSHELRTPLNAIIGFSEVLLEHLFGELNEKQNEYVDDILSSGRHLLSLINDILDLSKIEAGRMDLEMTTFDLPLAIANALLLVRERASRHGIKLDRVIDERLGDFTGDERKVKQILVNLLSNAVKFTPEGGQIKVDAGLGDSAVIVSVTDTGIGIAKEDQEAIFEEFRQASGNYAQKREGTGLGLTLTRKFVEMHGGKIWVESEIAKGSKFTFTLPVNGKG
jgi:GAF domain-containing protein